MSQTASAVETALAEIARYAATPDAARYPEIGRRLAGLGAAKDRWTEDDQTGLRQLLVASAKVEPVWGLLAGCRLWASGGRTPIDFQNIWNCAKYAGTHSPFSALSPQAHLDNVQAIYGQATTEAPFLIAGNALRQLHRYAEAESAYLQGAQAYPESPFPKFRLIDLWLMTYQPARAERLLASLKARYPQALEMLFAFPSPAGGQIQDNLLPALDPGDAAAVWLVAADPMYLSRYGARLAQGLAAVMPDLARPNGLTLHVHVLRDPATQVPAQVLQAMAAQVPLAVTQRALALSGASPNQRAALFACERFLFLAEMLAKYGRPMLVTDIDVDCLRDPRPLFDQMAGADILHTRFATCREAWDRYPATVLLFQPTPAALAFCRRLSGLLVAMLRQHPEPWFADQIALFRLIEGGLTPAKIACRDALLTSTTSPRAYFKLLHGSWQES